MISYIPKQNSEYPKRLKLNNLFYVEYKDSRPFFFHDKILNNKINDDAKTNVPNLDYFKDKYSHITNDYVLNSIFFEYCDYYIKYEVDEEINFAMLPLNPFGPTGIGGKGILKKWGPNNLVHPIIIYKHLDNNDNFKILVHKNSNNHSENLYYLPSGEQYNENYYSKKLKKILGDNLENIIDQNNSQFIYSGYINDSKNTDHSWLETSVYLYVLNDKQFDVLSNFINSDLNTKLKIIEFNDQYNLCQEHNEFLNMCFNYLN